MDLQDQPGHLIRRAQQIAVASFAEALGRELTPVQYAILRRLQQRPGIDQVTLAREVALDTSTAADIAARLENKGWIVRELLPRRQRRLLLTPAGELVLAQLLPGIEGMNANMLSGLEPEERVAFMSLLRKFVRLNENPARIAERAGPEAGP
jgi:DNA-binding MarR family transcriptional regulator